MVIKESIHIGWQKLTGKPLKLPLVTLIYCGIIFLFSYMGRHASSKITSLQFPLIVISLVVSLWLTAGYYFLIVRYVRENELEIRDLFKGTPFLADYTIGTFIFTLITCAGFLFPALFLLLGNYFKLKKSYLIMGGIILGIFSLIWYFYFAVKFYLYRFIIVDQNESALNALKLSSKYSKGYRNKLFYLIIITTLIVIFSLALAGIGCLWGNALSDIILTTFYFKLKDIYQKNKEEEEKTVVY